MKLLFKFFAPLMVTVLIGGCAGVAPKPPVAMGIPLQDICKQYNIQWQFDSVTQVIILEYKNHKAKALVGSSVVLIGQEKTSLSAPLRRQNSTIYVPDDFESKVIGPFGAVRSRLGFTGDLANLKVRTIILDPGHGGKDPGTHGYAGVKEKEVVLDVARRLKNILSDSGLKVIMTRDSDTFISLNERTEIAARSDADLFVSIHANFMPNNRRIHGVEVYFVRTNDKRDLDEDQRRKNERMFIKHLNAAPDRVLQAVVADMMYQLKTSQSAKLAMRIAHDASSELDTPNRGARH